MRLSTALLAAFFVAIFPGNIAQYVEGTDAFGLDTDRARLVRLFFQPVLVVWALWAGGLLDRRRRALPEEQRDEVGLAVDGQAATAWSTDRYRTADLGGLKPGVGLLLDLGAPTALSRVDVDLTAAGAGLEVRAGDRLGIDETSLPLVARDDAAREVARLVVPAGTRARYWLVWLTRLPADDGTPAVTGLTLSSLRTVPGDLYAALPGARVHGMSFAPDAVAAAPASTPRASTSDMQRIAVGRVARSSRLPPAERPVSCPKPLALAIGTADQSRPAASIASCQPPRRSRATW